MSILVWKEDINREYIEYKCMSDNWWLVRVPASWYNNEWQQNCYHNWIVTVNWWTPVTMSWYWWPWANISWPRWANEEVTVRITPASTPTYWWARAFWWHNFWHQYITEVIFDWSYMWYADSATNTWDNFRYYQYYWCYSLTVPPEEYLPDTVTNIWDSFRAGQFVSCGITYSPEECLPASVSYVWHQFRSSQYAHCNSLSEIRLFKDYTWTKFSWYRDYQYYECNTNKTIKVFNMYPQASNYTIFDNAYITQVQVPSAWLNDYINFNDVPRNQITDSKFVWY